MDYQNPYDPSYEEAATSWVDPANAPPGYHWEDGIGWVPDAPRKAVHNPAVVPPAPTGKTGEVINPGVTPPSPGQPGTLTDPAYYAPFTSAAPTFTYHSFIRPPDFKAPTGEEAANEPGYAFVRDEGDKAFMQTKAAEGLSRSAGTLKGLSAYNQSLAATQYGNVYARAAGQYQNMVNNMLAFDTQDFSHDDEGYQNSMREFLANRDTFYGNQSNPFNKLYSLASLGAQSQ